MTMKKHIKKIIAICIMVQLIFMLFGCGSTNETGNTTEAYTSEGTDAYVLYYMSSDWTDFYQGEINIDLLETTENIIDKIMNTIITVNEDATYQVPVADGMSYQRYSYDGQGIVTLMFNIDYETVENYQMLLSKMAFTKTLCQITGVSKVEFQMTDLIGEREVDISQYDEASFSSVDDDFMVSEDVIEIYVPDGTGQSLQKTEMTINYFLYATPEEQIIEVLKNSTGWTSPISAEMTILDIYTEENVCYVNFKSVSTDSAEFFYNNVYIYSVVNSLTSLDNVNSVVFMVEGSRNAIYGDVIDFKKNYTADYSYCE